MVYTTLVLYVLLYEVGKYQNLPLQDVPFYGVQKSYRAFSGNDW